MAKKRAPSNLLADDIRAAITVTGVSGYALAKATGVPQPTITRFLAGADMKLSTASKLAEHFGMRLRPRFVTIATQQIKDVAKTVRVDIENVRKARQTNG